MWDVLANFIVRKSVYILIVVIVGTALVGYNSTEQRVQWTLPRMLPDNDSSFIVFSDLKDKFGNNDQSVVVALVDNPLDNLQLFNAVYRLGKDLEELDGVDTVVAINQLFNVVKDTVNKRFDLQKIVSHELTTTAQLDSVRNLIYSLPFYSNRLIDSAHKVNLIVIDLNPLFFDSDRRAPLMNSVLDALDRFQVDNGVKMYYSGMSYIRTMITRLVKTELSQFILFVIIVTIIILLIFFRSILPVVVAMLIVLLGVTWSFGIIAFFNYEITILTSIIPSLIIVIGIPNSIYLINRYHSEYAIHGNKVLAISRVVRKIGQATLMTNLTTAIGFLAFVFTQSRILVEFGIVAFWNIMILFVLSIFTIPAILGVLPVPKKKQMYHLDRKILNRIISFIIRLVSFHRTIIYWVTVLIVLLCGFGLSLIKTTGNLSDDLPQDGKVIQDLNFVESSFNGIMPFEVKIDGLKPGVMSKASTYRKIERLENIFSKMPVFGKPLSVIEGVKYVKQAFYGGDPTKYALMKGNEQLFIKNYLDNSQGNMNLLSSFIDSTGRYGRVSVPMKDVGTLEMDSVINEITPKVIKIFPEDKFEVTYTGPSVVYLKGTKYLVKNLFQSLVLAIFIIAGLMATLFKSYRMIILSIAVNLLPLLFTGAMMGFFGIPLKPSTILVFSIAFGISIDDTIHFLAKYRQELVHCEWDIKPAVIESIKEAGVSMIYTSIILFFGFSVFASSEFGGTKALGILTSLTLLVAMIVNLILLPSLLLTMGKQVISNVFKEPFIQIIDEEEDIDYTGLRILHNNKDLDKE